MLNDPATINKADFFLKKDKTCEMLLGMFSIFSNVNRFKILCALYEKDFCVNDLSLITGGKPSNISQQLKILTLAGYLSKERNGKLINYHLKDENIRRLLNHLYKEFGS